MVAHLFHVLKYFLIDLLAAWFLFLHIKKRLAFVFSEKKLSDVISFDCQYYSKRHLNIHIAGDHHVSIDFFYKGE